MRCKICGAKLKNDGDICSNCYRQYQEEEKLKTDVNERLVVRRKYSIAYNLYRYLWIFVIFILSVIVCITSKEFLAVIELIIVLAIIIGLLLFIDKRVSIATKAVFYDTKVEYSFHFWIFNTHKVIKYEDIKDISVFQQSFLQKKFGYGDICIYAKGNIPGASLLNGFQIKNVENVSTMLDQISPIVGPLE